MCLNKLIARESKLRVRLGSIDAWTEGIFYQNVDYFLEGFITPDIRLRCSYELLGRSEIKKRTPRVCAYL